MEGLEYLDPSSCAKMRSVTLRGKNIATDGTIKVLSVVEAVHPDPPNIQISVSGNTLSLAWPINSGLRLLANSVELTAANRWFPYLGSANMTNVVSRLIRIKPTCSSG